jgi:hypothetical protein
MQIEKKLILCSILAVAIGIAAVAPLAYVMSTISTAKAETPNDVPWFNVNVPYAYYEATSQNGSSTYLQGIGEIDGLISYSGSHYIGLNYTVNPAKTTFANARIEYIKLHFYSDIGPIEDITSYYGANCTGIVDPTSSFFFSRNDWFNSTTSAGGTFLCNFNGTLYSDGESVGGLGGSYSSNSFANTTLPEKFLNAQNAQAIYLDVSRIGYVTFDGNNTIVTLANNSVIQHIELTKNGNEFSYGNVPANRIKTPGFSTQPSFIG